MTEQNNPQDIINELEQEMGTGDLGAGVAEGNEIPKGTVVLRITNAFLNRARTSGRKQLSAELEILEHSAGPKYIGRKVFKNWGIEEIKNISYLNRDLQNLEIKIVETAKDFLRIQNELNGVCFEAALVPNKDAQYGPNFYINGPSRRRDAEENPEKFKNERLGNAVVPGTDVAQKDLGF